jgi:hypothetical protein
MMAEGPDEFPFDWIAGDLREGTCIPFLGAAASSFPKGGVQPGASGDRVL